MINKAFNYINQKLLIIIFIFCILIVCISLIAVYSNRIIFTETDRFEGIEIETVMNTCEKYNAAIYYPTTENNIVNRKIKDFIDTYIIKIENDTKYYTPKDENDKFNLLIEYEIGRVNKDIISFIFVINYSYKSAYDTEIITRSFNLKSGKELTLDDFFDKGSDYSSVLCHKAIEFMKGNKEINDRLLNWFVDDINNSSLNSFDGYSFTNTHLSVYFNSNKLSSSYNEIYELKVYWEDVRKLLKKNIYYKDENNSESKSVSLNIDNVNDNDVNTNNEDDSENNLYFPAFNINITNNDKVVALTFDDGPHYIYTDKILKYLGKKNLVATFFVLGNRLEYNKELLIRMVDLGCEIGNHSLSHKQLTNIRDKEVINQIETVNKSIKRITGYDIRAVRPPYGSSNSKVEKLINKPIVLWNIDPQDWKSKNPEKIKHNVLSNVKSGSIILMHDIYETSVDASIMIIDELLKQGYKFLTVSQMLELQDTSTNGKVFTHKK